MHQHSRHPRHTDCPPGRDQGLECTCAGLRSPPIQWRPPAPAVLSDSGRVLFLRLERRSQHFLAPREETHGASSNTEPRLCLQPVLHTKQRTPLGNHPEQRGPPAAEGNGSRPWPAETQKKREEDPLGKRTEHKRHPHPHNTTAAHSKRARFTQRTLALTKPHGTPPCRLNTPPASLWASGSCSWTWANAPLLGSGPFPSALPGNPPDAE